MMKDEGVKGTVGKIRRRVRMVGYREAVSYTNTISTVGL